MAKNKIKKGVKNVIENKKTKVNLILGVILLLLIVLLIIVISSRSPLLSPETFNKLSYEEFSQRLFPEIMSGQFGLVQLGIGQITSDEQFTTNKIQTFDTTVISQASQLNNQIIVLENTQSSFQIITNFMTPFQQSYIISGSAFGSWIDTGQSCEDTDSQKPSEGYATGEHTCPSNANCPKGQKCLHQTTDRSSGCDCWKYVSSGPDQV